MPRLSIHLLGSFQVNLDGEPVTGFESDKVRALLAYLAVEVGGPHRREKLAGLCWPELPERSARNNLRVALANLRKLLGDHARAEAQGATPSFLRVSRQSIQINPEADVWLDATALTQRLETTGRPRRVVHRLAEAVELYRGGFLEGLSLPDSVALEEWALLEREHLQRQVVTGLRWLTGWHEARGEYRQALHYARRQVWLEPWQEQGQRQVMRLLALTGQRNAALAQYQALRRTLADDLGVEPDDKTDVLYQRIRGGKDVRLAIQEWPHNLPTSLLPFVGREKELDEIYASLRAPGCRLLSLVGPGGSGKTRLALEAASDLLSSGALSGIESDSSFQPADGIVFVPLARLGSTASITPTAAHALGFTFRDGLDPRQQLLDHLRQKKMLLILDNFEHLLKGANWVVDLLRAAPDIRILITSRSRLNLQAEHPLAVAGLAIPGEHVLASGTLDRLRRYDSVELFCAGAMRAQPDFRLTTDNTVDVVRICRLLDGMPLGILLAASWMDSMTPAQIASEIGQSLDFLGSDWLDLPARQRSLRAVFDHSWTLLGEHEQEILRTLSVFRSGFTSGAVQAVAGASLRGLRRLVNHCLLHYAPSGRYEIHELLRQYAAEKLEASGRADAASNAHSAYYTAALKQWGVDLKGPKQQEALADLEVEIENARTAWNWAAKNGKVARLAGALDGLCHFYEWQVRPEEGEAACRVAAQGLAATDESVTILSVDGQRLLARVLVWQGTFTYLLGRVDPARQLLCRGLALLKELDRKGHDTRAEQAHALLQSGSATLDIDREEAKGYCERSLELYRVVGDRWGTAKVLGVLGSVRRRLGLYGTETKQLLEESLALYEALRDRRGIAQSRGTLANLLAFRWELEESARLYQE
ncbi:MAG: BTAD domain-containing putative transcriptional regulator, partial [Anaerolineae bacterium]